jgi:hypothetical protein
MTHRYLIKIDNQNSQYRAEIYQKKDAAPLHISERISLAPTDKITIKEKQFPLSQLIDALIQYKDSDLKLAYDERGQLAIGQYLYQQIFSNADSAILKPLKDENSSADLRIISHDEHICRIPWVLLADEHANFLSALNCTVSLSAHSEFKDCELPPSPKILIVMPQPAGVPETKAESHLEQLEDMLSAADQRHYRGRNLKAVFTYEDFQEQLKNFQPHVLYYYGHGTGNADTSRLVFAAGKERKQQDVPIADIADSLRQLPEYPPLVVYLNCCLGDAGGALGAGIQLRNIVPAVLTNRTVAKIEAAQSQAMAFWRSTLLDGLPPHRAMNEIRHNLGKQNLSLGDARWLTPVLHCHYDQWKANPPQPVSRFIRDPYWHLKIDRVKQISRVFYRTTNMLLERKPRSLAYLWYGGENQGVDLFHHRLKVELQEKLRDVILYEVLPAWPPQLINPHDSFEAMMTEAFDVQTLNHIPGRIRTATGGVSGKQILVYMRHEPLRSTKVFTLDKLRDYLEWWDSQFAPLLDGQVFGLLSLSFVVGNPKKFHAALSKRGMDELPLHDTSYDLLDEMEHLAKKDLLDFLKTHNIRLPQSRQDKVLEDILKETRGQYEMTLQALKDLVSRAWDLSEDAENGDKDDDEDEGFGADD